MSEIELLEPPELEEQLTALRPELTSYCYRMLGSAFDAEDAVQETLVRAWRGSATFQGRATLRSWLYRIATNVCLTHLRHAQRRALPIDVQGEGHGEASVLGARLPRHTWVEPVPDAWVVPPDLEPAQLAVTRESVRLAFVAALQLLTPRQRAVLLLRDVLQWRTAEVADLLGTSADAVNGVLRRARTVLRAWRPDAPARMPDDGDRDLLTRYLDAFERFDIDALVGLLAEEATLSMPPYALWFRGSAAIGRWFRASGAACRHARVIPVEANGTLGLAVYRPSADGLGYRAFAIHIAETAGGRITALHVFLDPALFPAFGLARTLPGGGQGSCPISAVFDQSPLIWPQAPDDPR
jgi:RNA polymerase sigma-70 factor (ECF subfamily)